MAANKRFPELSANAQRGSKPRCHLLTSATADIVAERLTALVQPFATVSPADKWMPQGFADCTEAEMDKAERLLDPRRRRELAEWWLPSGSLGAKTPNFDIASTCAIDGHPGLLLIEAKAHDQELKKEAVGRQLLSTASEARRGSHPTIGAAIESARAGLRTATQLNWEISRDSCYQISNRFAWSWKLAELGIPVVLVYLGFLNAAEMADQGEPLADTHAWSDLVLEHANGVVPESAWGRSWSIAGTSFTPLIRSLELAL